MDKSTKFTETVASFLNLTAKVLPDDVLKRLAELKAREKLPMAEAIYDCMFRNIELAKKMDRPLCQDTGVIQFFLKVGTRFPLIDELEPLLVKATEIATVKAPLRHNAVETFHEKNTGTNTGKKVPYIEYELVPGSDELVMDVYMAGGGCSLPGRAVVMMPSAGYEGIADFVADTLVTLGVNACPPLVVGVGVGTCVASSAKLAKKASLRTVGSRNPDPLVARMEEDLENTLNDIAIGPQGISGSSSVLCVNIENMARHPSALGVGVAFGCWAHRRGTIHFDSEINYTILSHKEAKL